MKVLQRITALAILAILLSMTGAYAQEGDAPPVSLADAIAAGDASVALRYRYEYVNDDNPSLIEDTAHASTVRLRLNYQTGTWRKWSAFGEFDYVAEVLATDFNSLGGSSPERDRYPVVADPKGPDLQRLYVDYQATEDTRFRIGRQSLFYNNQRFIGRVAWRQNEQSYDALSVTTTAIGDTTLEYAYVGAVRRIFGDDVPAGSHNVDAHFLNVEIPLADNWRVAPYLFHVDNDDVAAFSTSTFGIRATGSVPLDDNKLDLAAEFATQRDAANNPVDFDANYYHLSATYALANGLSFGLGFESLGGDANQAGSAFRTPLATLHAFNGWTDKFLATPGAGLEDLYVSVRGKAGKWTLAGIFHDFSAEDSSADWGTEIDLSAGRPLNDRYGLLLKAAFYDADLLAADTTKLWLMLTASW